MHRRTFLHWCSLALSGFAVLFAAVPGIGFLVDPLLRAGSKKKWHRLLKLSDLEIGVPRKLAIIDQRIDAWTRYPEGSVGAVWLIRRDETNIDVFSAICPHLGCRVDFVASDDQFFCKCHRATYTKDGGIVSGPQKRGLDKLEWKIEKTSDDEWLSVVFQQFEPGIAEQVPLA